MGILGLVFFLGTAVGMVRFPDFYTRMHAAGKGDTLSTMLMLSGFGLVMMEDFSIGSWLLLLKILGIVLFIFITTPTSSHALMRAAFEDDEMPRLGMGIKTGRRMGHLPISGADGPLIRLANCKLKSKRFFHINNSNPIWDKQSDAYQAIQIAGWDTCHDGLALTI